MSTESAERVAQLRLELLTDQYVGALGARIEATAAIRAAEYAERRAIEKVNSTRAALDDAMRAELAIEALKAKLARPADCVASHCQPNGNDHERCRGALFAEQDSYDALLAEHERDQRAATSARPAGVSEDIMAIRSERRAAAAASHFGEICIDSRGVNFVPDGTGWLVLPAGWAMCGECSTAWDDTISTSVTPAPSGRCPFEATEHAGEWQDVPRAATIAGNESGIRMPARGSLDT